MNRLISINEAPKQLGVSISTLRRWDESGVLVAQQTPKGHRRYNIKKINPNLLHGIGNKNRKTIATHDCSKAMAIKTALLHHAKSLD